MWTKARFDCNKGLKRGSNVLDNHNKTSEGYITSKPTVMCGSEAGDRPSPQTYQSGFSSNFLLVSTKSFDILGR